MARRIHRLPAFEHEGVLLVDKSKDWTSFDVVNVLRNTFNIAKVGHCGTLDPNATGLLVIVIGKYTKRADEFTCDSKMYDAEILLGKTSDSLDIMGNITSESAYEHIQATEIEAVLNTFLGDQMQLPPMMSAIKINGQKLYVQGRKGVEVERERRAVTIHKITLQEIQLPYVRISVHCSKGTYIRSLADDIGKKLGCGALLSELRRTQSGQFQLQADTPTPEELKTFTQETLAKRIIIL